MNFTKDEYIIEYDLLNKSKNPFSEGTLPTNITILILPLNIDFTV